MPARGKFRYIIITGPACAGKTFHGAWLADKLGLPFLRRDVIMDILFENLNGTTPQMRWKYRKTSYALLFFLLETFFRRHRPLVIESGFHPEEHEPTFRRLQQRYQALPIQVHFSAATEILVRRFRQRVKKRMRHTGWGDEGVDLMGFQRDIIRGLYDPLNIGGWLIRVDTSQRLSLRDRCDMLEVVQACQKRRHLPSRTACVTSNWSRNVS